jgi:chalcone isomerase
MQRHGIYLDKSDALLERLDKWKGKKPEELAGDEAFFQGTRSSDARSSFFEALASDHVEKLSRVLVIKEIKCSQYGVQLESSVRDRLVAADKYEEEALDKVTEFFRSKYLKPSSVVTFHFPTTRGPAQARKSASPLQEQLCSVNCLTQLILSCPYDLFQISIATEGKDEAKITVQNEDVAAGMIQKWYLGGSSAVSPTTVRSLPGRPFRGTALHMNMHDRSSATADLLLPVQSNSCAAENCVLYKACFVNPCSFSLHNNLVCVLHILFIQVYMHVATAKASKPEKKDWYNQQI